MRRRSKKRSHRFGDAATDATTASVELACVGCWLGARDGRSVDGLRLGIALGLAVARGDRDGRAVIGAVLGAALGTVDGARDGAALGVVDDGARDGRDVDGARLGARDGSNVGARLGDADGARDGAVVDGANVGESVGGVGARDGPFVQSPPSHAHEYTAHAGSHRPSATKNGAHPVAQSVTTCHCVDDAPHSHSASGDPDLYGRRAGVNGTGVGSQNVPFLSQRITVRHLPVAL